MVQFQDLSSRRRSSLPPNPQPNLCRRTSYQSFPHLKSIRSTPFCFSPLLCEASKLARARNLHTCKSHRSLPHLVEEIDRSRRYSCPGPTPFKSGQSDIAVQKKRRGSLPEKNCCRTLGKSLHRCPSKIRASLAKLADLQNLELSTTANRVIGKVHSEPNLEKIIIHQNLDHSHSKSSHNIQTWSSHEVERPLRGSLATVLRHVDPSTSTVSFRPSLASVGEDNLAVF